MFRNYRIAVGLFTAALLASAQPGSAQERFTLQGHDVALYNLAGTLRVVAGSGNAVEVEITRAGRDASQLRIANDAIDGVPTLRVIYPGDEVVYTGLRNRSESDFEVQDDGTFGRSSRGRRVRVVSPARAHGDGTEAHADVVLHVPAGVRLNAHWGTGNADVTAVNGDVSVSNATGEITAHGTRGQLKLGTASGSIDASDVDGMTSLETASGSVHVANARGEGVRVNVASGRVTAESLHADQIDLETASGEVRVRGVEAKQLRVNAASGSIHAYDVVAPEARMHTASGSIEADLHGDVRTLLLDSSSGSVHLRLPESTNAQFDVSTSSGSIDVDLPIQVREQRRGHMRGTIGNGAGRISINTASGSVTLTGR